MSIQKSLKKVFRPQKYKQDKLQNKLAQEIAKKVIDVCNSYDKFLTEAEKIDFNKGITDDNLKTFLKGLACGMTKTNDLKSRMETFTNSKKNIGALYNLKDQSEKQIAEILVGTSTDVSTIYLMQYVTKMPLLIKELVKGVEKKVKQTEDTIADKVKNEILKKIEEAHENVTEFSKRLNSIHEKIKSDKALGEKLIECANNVGKELQNEFSETLNQISAEQKILKEMCDGENTGSIEKKTRDLLKENREEYKNHLNTILSYVKQCSESGEYTADAQKEFEKVRDFLEKKYNKLFPENFDSNSENWVQDFLNDAGEIRNKLVIENDCDQKIKQEYGNMDSCFTKSRQLLIQLEELNQIKNRKNIEGELSGSKSGG